MLGQGYLLRPAAVVVTTTATVAPVSAAVGTSSGEQSAVEDFKEMVDNFPPNVLAMLVKLLPFQTIVWMPARRAVVAIP